jgi:hypothetical protein
VNPIIPASMPQVDPRNAIESANRDETRLEKALEEYIAVLDSGQVPEKQAFLARYPDIANELANCLDGVNFIHQVAPQLGENTVGGVSELERAARRPPWAISASSVRSAREAWVSSTRRSRCLSDAVSR